MENVNKDFLLYLISSDILRGIFGHWLQTGIQLLTIRVYASGFLEIHFRNLSTTYDL